MKDRPQIRLDNVLFLGFIWIQIKSETKYMDLDLDSILSMGWVRFQICEILWIRFWGWIHFRPQIGSDYGFVLLFGFGLIFFLKSESVNPNP